MAEELPLPRYTFRPDAPSLWAMLRTGVSDPASVFPAAILEQPAVQLPGPGAPLLVADPELVREVLNDREGRFASFPMMRRLLRRAWGDGLAGAEEESWQRQRRAAAPAFRPQAVEANCAKFAAAADNSARSLPLGEPLELTALTGRIIAEIVFTALVDGHGSVDPAQVAADVPAYIRRIGGFSARDLLPLPESWHDRLSGIASDPAGQRIRALAQRLAALQAGTAKSGTFASLIADAGPLEDNIRGLFPAALETTVAGVSWTLYTLAQRPEWQTQVAAEARKAGAMPSLEALPLTRRVVQEVLRLYPPAPLLARAAAVAGELGGYRLRKGQPVTLNIYAMHRHHTLWDNPDSFDPDRFLPERGVHPGWLPFGAGPRVCIAAQFALAEIVVVVARLIGAFELVPSGPEPVVSLQVTTRSLTGLHVIATTRASGPGPFTASAASLARSCAWRTASRAPPSTRSSVSRSRCCWAGVRRSSILTPSGPIRTPTGRPSLPSTASPFSMPRFTPSPNGMSVAAGTSSGSTAPLGLGFGFGAALAPSARRMKSAQIRAGAPPPVAPASGVLSSLPIHTPTTRSPAKPTNSASRLSCVVPVLP